MGALAVAEHPESRWEHPQCSACWYETHPGRTPVRLVVPEMEMCCRCGLMTSAGIYVRADAKEERWALCPRR